MRAVVAQLPQLWYGGQLAPQDKQVVLRCVLEQVRWAVDGFAAWTIAILPVFRDPMHTGKRGRPPLVVWADLHIVQVVKPYTERRLTSVQRRLAHGWMQGAEPMMHATQVGLGVINTTSSERLNATFRTWLPALTRRSRTPARQHK